MHKSAYSLSSDTKYSEERSILDFFDCDPDHKVVEHLVEHMFDISLLIALIFVFKRYNCDRFRRFHDYTYDVNSP